MTLDPLPPISFPTPASEQSEERDDTSSSNSNRSAEATLFATALTARLNHRTTADELDEAALRDQQQQQQIRHAAEQLVASAFILPFLQQVRHEPMRSDLFHGGFAEDAFGQQLDTHLADQIVRGSNFPLVDAVEQYITPHGRHTLPALGREVNVHG